MLNIEPMQPEPEESKPAENITKEGEKVSGGEESAQNQTENTASGQNSATGGGSEVSPQSDTKKEDMTSYNEHPDQEKVGGG